MHNREIISEELQEQLGQETEEKLNPPTYYGNQLEIKNFELPDDVLIFNKERIELVTLDKKTVCRITLQPGWKWSSSASSLSSFSSQLPFPSYFQFHLSGILKVKMKTGEE